MGTYSLDYETTSACDIKLGGYRYAADPSTRILMFAIAEGDKDPRLWCATSPNSEESLAALALLQDAVATRSLIYAFNAAFELAISTYRMKPDLGLDPPDINQWRCTQAMCRRAAAPESLAKAAEFFGLGDQKDPIGKALIGVFSDQEKPVMLEPPPGMKDPATIKVRKNGSKTAGRKPKSRRSASPILDEPVLWDWLVKVDGRKMSVREAWETFCNYCRQDVRVERELHRKIKHFELKGDVLESFLFDLRMNHRGVPVNVAALENGQRIVDHLTDKLGARFTRTTGVSPTQRAKVLEWLQERGYPADNMQAATVEEVLDAPPAAMPPLAVEALRDYSLVGFAALAKIPTMLRCVCPDGYIRGTTQWHGARTGRAAGRLVQPQNLRRPTVKDTDLCYRMIREGWEPHWFEDLWESPLEALASSIRHFFQPHEGVCYSADFVGVENRLAAWVAGETEELAMMVAGEDMYKHMAVKLFGVPYDKVTKEQRTTAKPVVLACGYQVGGRTLQNALATIYKTEKTRDECNEYVRIYRKGHPNTVQAWRDMQAAAVQSIKRPGVAFPVLDGKVEFKCGRVAGINYMTMRLPSGRRLYYPWPETKVRFMQKDDDGADYIMLDPEKDTIDEERGFYTDHVSFYAPIAGKVVWGRVGTYGGRLFENLCQAMGVDLLNHGCLEAERAGFDIRLIVHDEILALHDGRSVEELQRHFCAKQEWARTFPLDSSATEVPYYLKD